MMKNPLERVEVKKVPEEEKIVKSCPTCCHSSVSCYTNEIRCYHEWHKFDETGEGQKFGNKQIMSPNKTCEDWKKGTEDDIRRYRNSLIMKSRLNCNLHNVEWTDDEDAEILIDTCEHPNNRCFDCPHWRSMDGKTVQEASQEIIDAMGGCD